MPALHDAPTPPFAGPGLGLALGCVLFVLVGIFLLKFWYMKQRRIQSIHTPPDRVLDFGPTSLDESSIWTQNASHLSGLGVHDGEKRRSLLATSLPFPPPPVKSKIGREAFMVGMLGSPKWEIKITRMVDTTTRTEAAAERNDIDVIRAVDDIPMRRLGHMASRSTLNVNSPGTIHSIFNSVGASPHTPFSPTHGSPPAYNSTLSLPFGSPTPPKAHALLALDSPSLVTPTSSLTLPDICPPPRALSHIGLQNLAPADKSALGLNIIPPKAVARLGMQVPLGPPSPTWTEYSTGSLLFAATRNDPPLPAPIPIRERSPSVTSSISSSESRFSVQRKPVPRLEAKLNPTQLSSLSSPLSVANSSVFEKVSTHAASPQTVTVASVKSALRHPPVTHQRVRSLSSIRSVRIVEPVRSHGVVHGARIGVVGSLRSTQLPPPPHKQISSGPELGLLPRRTRSASVLRDLAYPRLGDLTIIAEGTTKAEGKVPVVNTLRPSVSMPRIRFNDSRPVTPRDLSSPPAICVTAPSPAKRPSDGPTTAKDSNQVVFLTFNKTGEDSSSPASLGTVAYHPLRRSETPNSRMHTLMAMPVGESENKEHRHSSLQQNNREHIGTRPPLAPTTRSVNTHSRSSSHDTFGLPNNAIKRGILHINNHTTRSSSILTTFSSVANPRSSLSSTRSTIEDEDALTAESGFDAAVSTIPSLAGDEERFERTITPSEISSDLDLTWSSDELWDSSRNGPSGGNTEVGNDELSAVYAELFSYWNEDEGAERNRPRITT